MGAVDLGNISTVSLLVPLTHLEAVVAPSRPVGLGCTVESPGEPFCACAEASSQGNSISTSGLEPRPAAADYSVDARRLP